MSERLPKAIEDAITAELAVEKFEWDEMDRDKLRAVCERMIDYWSKQNPEVIRREIAFTERRLAVLRHTLEGGA